MRELMLKVAATAMTLVATVAAAVFVGGHVRNDSAPLHPPIMGASLSRGASGDLTLTPSVRTGDAETVTSTYVS
jgi:hypothetical protein